jgi:anti-sigma regulatory factor (Ser/Thr protein kinase)
VTAPAGWRFGAAGVATRLREASDELETILTERGLSERARFAARLVAEELVLNAIQHGGAGIVTMETDPDGDPYRLTFEDDGVPFDPTPPPQPRASDAPGEVSPRGRGLILLHGFTRAMEYRLADGHNRLSVLLVE